MNILYKVILMLLYCVSTLNNQKRCNKKTPLSVQQLRTETAAYMLTHADDFKPFVDLEEDTHESFEAYCEAIKSTSSWGGQLELKALTHYLRVPILIHSAYSPDVVMGEEYEGSPLHLSFHQHYYTLGEHYNSVVPSD
ncbi:OTU domain-containing protein 6B [Balamuthia mandrillaris]